MNGSTQETIENFVALINDSMYVTSFVTSFVTTFWKKAVTWKSHTYEKLVREKADKFKVQVQFVTDHSTNTSQHLNCYSVTAGLSGIIATMN